MVAVLLEGDMKVWSILSLAVVFAAGPLAAAERTVADDPLALVTELYRAPVLPEDDGEEDVAPPEEPPIYSQSLRALLEVDSRRDMNFLDFDWVWGGQDLPDARDLKIVQVSRSDAAARIRVTFVNYREKRERLIDLVVEDGRWVIEDVYLKVPEGEWLSRVLTENRQD
jgi:hypothetical protein